MIWSLIKVCKYRVSNVEMVDSGLYSVTAVVSFFGVSIHFSPFIFMLETCVHFDVWNIFRHKVMAGP